MKIEEKNINITITENEIVTTPQLPKIKKINNNNVSKFENCAKVLIGPRNVRKTQYMLEIIEKLGNKRPIHIKARSPIQYPNYKTSTEIKPINKNKGAVFIFHDMLGARNSSQNDDFFTRDRNEDLDV